MFLILSDVLVKRFLTLVVGKLATYYGTRGGWTGWDSVDDRRAGNHGGCRNVCGVVVITGTRRLI